MPFKKGISGNPQGRKKGSTYNYKLRQQIVEYCEENLLHFLEEMKSMKTGHAKSQAFLTLLNYALPKLTENNSIFDIENLNDEQLNLIIEKLLKDENNLSPESTN